MKPSIFIGSSSERVDVAEAVEVNLSRFADVASWKHAFRPGRPFFQEITRSAATYDFAVLVLTPDDILVSRNVEYNSPRDNLLFELGLFIGSIGPDRVFAILDETIDTKILSDYAGIRILGYNGKRADRDLRQAVSPACVEVKDAVTALGPRDSRRPGEAPPLPFAAADLVGLRTIYPNFPAAEP